MSDLVEVPFYGEAIQAAREGERVQVVVKRVCEGLGLDHATQLTKLKSKPWAVVGLIPTTGPDGKTYETACIDLDSLPMWLATIDAARVKPEARFKLAAYQKECARVLRDHFFGRREPAPAPAPMPVDLLGHFERRFDSMLSPFLATVQTLAKSLSEMSGATISRPDAIWLKHEVREIAKLQVHSGLVQAKTTKSAEASARRRIYNKLGAATGWLGTGRDWRSLPAARWPEARALLIELRRDLPPDDRQLKLVKP